MMTIIYQNILKNQNKLYFKIFESLDSIYL